MKPIQDMGHGRVVFGDRHIQDVQVQEGYTNDGGFYRTAIICRQGITESIDIISSDGTHLARINICSGEWPSVDVYSTLGEEVIIRQNGAIVHRYPNPTPNVEVHLTR